MVQTQSLQSNGVWQFSLWFSAVTRMDTMGCHHRQPFRDQPGRAWLSFDQDLTAQWNHRRIVPTPRSLDICTKRRMVCANKTAGHLLVEGHTTNNPQINHLQYLYIFVAYHISQKDVGFSQTSLDQIGAEVSKLRAAEGTNRPTLFGWLIWGWNFDSKKCLEYLRV